MPLPAAVGFGGARRISRPAICLVTPGRNRSGDDRNGVPLDDVVDLAARASAWGIDLVQVREPQLADHALLTLVRDVLRAVDRSRTAVVVNDRIDIALAAAADGVHLPGDAVPASRVRAIAPAGFVIGRSIHSVAEALAAEQDGGADYLIFGTVFPSFGKPAGHGAAGVAALANVCSNTRLPVIAIGGMSSARVPDVAAAGAAGIAAISLFADADRHNTEEMTALVRECRDAFDR